ncbi:YtxH domain-containing protein [Carnobacterium divergens]
MAHPFFKGLLFGSIIGGVSTLLTNPRSGKENRDLALSYIDDTTLLVEDVSNSIHSLKGAITELSTEGLSLLNEFTEEMTDSVEEFTIQNEPRMRRIEEKATKLTADLEEFSELMPDLEELTSKE